MPPANFPMALRRNAPEGVRLSLSSRDDSGALIPYDLTDCSLRLQVRLFGGAIGSPLLSLLSDGGPISIETPASGGIVEIDWPTIADAIAALPASGEPGCTATFAYDLLVIASDGQAQAILEGPVPVAPGVTIV